MSHWLIPFIPPPPHHGQASPLRPASPSSGQPSAPRTGQAVPMELPTGLCSEERQAGLTS